MAVLKALAGGRRGRVAAAACGVLWAAVWAAAPAAPAWSAAAARPPERELEYKVKAAFLYNFAKFVDWPPGAFPDAKSPLTLCILGEDPFGPFLDQTVAGESIGGRPIAVQRGARLADLKGCHLLFIGRAERGRLREVIAALHDGPVLTVGEEGSFLDDGGMIDLVLEGNRVRFEANLAAVDRSPLKISSKLLRLARQVRPATGGGGR